MTVSAQRLQVLATRFVTETQAQWADLCEIACSISPKRLDNAAKVLAGNTNGNKDTLKRKMEAIQYAQSKGIETEAMKAIGQAKIVSDYVTYKKGERTEELAALTYRMAPDLKDKVQKQFVRIARTLKLTTSDQLFEFLHSVMVDWTEEEILHAAGEGVLNEPKRIDKETTSGRT